MSPACSRANCFVTFCRVLVFKKVFSRAQKGGERGPACAESAECLPCAVCLTALSTRSQVGCVLTQREATFACSYWHNWQPAGFSTFKRLYLLVVPARPPARLKFNYGVDFVSKDVSASFLLKSRMHAHYTKVVVASVPTSVMCDCACAWRSYASLAEFFENLRPTYAVNVLLELCGLYQVQVLIGALLQSWTCVTRHIFFFLFLVVSCCPCLLFSQCCVVHCGLPYRSNCARTYKHWSNCSARVNMLAYKRVLCFQETQSPGHRCCHKTS